LDSTAEAIMGCGRKTVNEELENAETHFKVLSQLRFQVLTAASMKMTVFWDVASCSLVEVY
jgi:hypothetical protein